MVGSSYHYCIALLILSPLQSASSGKVGSLVVKKNDVVVPPSRFGTASAKGIENNNKSQYTASLLASRGTDSHHSTRL